MDERYYGAAPALTDGVSLWLDPHRSLKRFLLFGWLVLLAGAGAADAAGAAGVACAGVGGAVATLWWACEPKVLHCGLIPTDL